MAMLKAAILVNSNGQRAKIIGNQFRRTSFIYSTGLTTSLHRRKTQMRGKWKCSFNVEKYSKFILTENLQTLNFSICSLSIEDTVFDTRMCALKQLMGLFMVKFYSTTRLSMNSLMKTWSINVQLIHTTDQSRLKIHQTLKYDFIYCLSVLKQSCLKVWIDGQEDVFSLSINNPRVLTLPFQIEPVDDLPYLILGPNGEILNVTPSSKQVIF